MVSRIGCVCIDSVDPGPLADFWMAVLDWVVVDQDETGVSLAAPGRGMPTLDILKVPDGKAVKNRLHLDLRADGSTTEAELARLEALGASRVDVGQGPEVSWAVLADPEGNEFCLLKGTVQEIEAAASAQSIQ